ncbi:hypothetical protein GBAR_LOCUS15720, partial [Geodia barretti]
PITGLSSCSLYSYFHLNYSALLSFIFKGNHSVCCGHFTYAPWFSSNTVT